MYFFSWLRNRQTNRRGSRVQTSSRRLLLEPLEDRCLLSAGALDQSFDGDGIVTTDIGVTDFEMAWDVAVYPATAPDGTPTDGKIVAVGQSVPRFAGQTPDYDFALVRYNPDGSLDGGFGKGGIVTTDFTKQDWAASVEIVAAGKIVVGGSTGGKFALAQYLPDGSLDATFGGKGKGKVTTTIGKNAAGLVMKAEDDGKIIMAGVSDGNLALVRYTAGGALDKTFSGDGKVVSNLGVPIHSNPSYMDMLIYPSKSADAGKILVAARDVGTPEDSIILVARYTVDGVLDPTFGDQGIVRFQNAGVDRISATLQSDGRVVLAYDVGGEVHLTQLTAEGSLDPTFGVVGTAVLSAPDLVVATSITTDANGRLLVAATNGYWSYNQPIPRSFLVARFLSDGNLDPTFGNGGIATVTGVVADLRNVELLVQANGKIVLAGGTEEDIDPAVDGTNVHMDFVTLRLLGDDALSAASSSTQPVQHELSAQEVQPLLAEAIHRWQAAGVDTSSLYGIDIRIADLGDTTLGLASGNTIWIDDNAAGWGWFVDSTPGDDSEFITPGDQGEMNRMDLLSVLEHELGHVLGFEHEDGGVMSPMLAPGERLGLGSAEVWEQALYALAQEQSGKG